MNAHELFETLATADSLLAEGNYDEANKRYKEVEENSAKWDHGLFPWPAPYWKALFGQGKVAKAKGQMQHEPFIPKQPKTTIP